MNINKTYKASTIDEALKVLEEYKEKAKLIAGGTDVVIELRGGHIDPEMIIDISHIDEMKYIKEEEGYIHIGAGTTFTDIAHSELLDNKLSGLKKSASLVGSPQIRNKGTVGGNICNGSPAADIVPPLLALDSVLTIKSSKGEREVKLEDIFLGKGKVDIDTTEILTEISFKKPLGIQKLGFSKLGLRNALAISRICIAVYLDLDESNKIKNIKVASGALGVNGLREREVEEIIIGKELNEETLNIASKKMAEIVEERLKGRSSLEYKGRAVKSLFEEAIKLAAGKTLSL